MGGAIELGRRGEDAAVEYLRGQGMEVIARNWRCSLGEVDIVAVEGAVLVFCEVKTRRSTRFGTPLAGITPAKAARLRRLVGAWLAGNDAHRGPVRIDALGILWHPGGSLEVTHVRGAA